MTATTFPGAPVGAFASGAAPPKAPPGRAPQPPQAPAGPAVPAGPAAPLPPDPIVAPGADPSSRTIGNEVPVRAAGLQLIGDMEGSGYRQPPALVRRADGQILQLSRLIYLLLEAIDGTRDVDAIAAEVTASSGRTVRATDVRKLVDTRLRPLGLLRLPDGTEPHVERANPLLALRFRYAVTDPKTTRRVTAPFAWLFHAPIVAIGVCGFLAICGWALFVHGLGFATYQAFRDPGLLLAVLAITLVSAGFHEFGHAAAARYGGATPGAMGAGLYLLWPAFYTDVTDSYRLNRTGRIRTDLGGVYFNALFGVVLWALWMVTGWSPFLLAIATQILQILRQMPPLLRFDGYHLLADVTGVPDLYYRIKPALLGLLPSHWRSPESKVLKPWAKAVVTAWVLLVVPFMVGSVALTVVELPHIIATAATGLAAQWHQMVHEMARGDVALGLLKVVGVIAIGLPVLGICYMLARTSRRVGRGIWRRTAGRPLHRAASLVAAAAVCAGLGVAWWPHDHNYQPIEPYDRGTVQDALPASFRQALPGPLDAGATPGTTAGTMVLRGAPHTPMPTPSHPALALVLIPRTSASGSVGATWVFPFNRPPPPGRGDNQALAVNTANGSTVYEVAFALVWANGSQPVRNQNSAYAFADCAQCQTIAVSFQVVLIVGDAHDVVPQNIAGAVNYDCISCVTEALAHQLVVSLPKDPSAQEVSAIDVLWQQIFAFGQQLQGLSYTQIETHLQTYESQIRSVVTKYSSPASPSSPSSPSGSPPSSGSTGKGSGTGSSRTSTSSHSSKSSTASTSGTPSGSTTTGSGGTGSTTTGQGGSTVPSTTTTTSGSTTSPTTTTPTSSPPTGQTGST